MAPVDNLQIPMMASSAYASNTMSLDAGNFLGYHPVPAASDAAVRLATQTPRRTILGAQATTATTHQPNIKEPLPMTTPKRRLVKVVIVDPNENIPLDQCVLYSGDEKVTDATDQELFFEIDIKDMLAKHNERRVKLVDKKVKERTEHLEPAKIRDLKMVVVNIAEF